MKTEEGLKYEINPSVYSRLLKRSRENKKEIYCGRCRYHKGENSPRYMRHTSWKKNRRRQYK